MGMIPPDNSFLREGPTMIGFDYEMAEEYLAECRKHLATMEPDLLAIERQGEEIDERLLSRVLRAVHSVMSGAKFFDFVKIQSLAEEAGGILELIRTRELAPTSDTISGLLRAMDRLNELCQSPAASELTDVTKVLADLAKLCADQSPAAQPGKTTTVAKTLDARGPLRVLLVEDDFVSRLVLQSFLSRYGECHVAVNGREAVRAFRSAMERGQGYDLICMDIMMPEMNGREAVRLVRTLEEDHGILMTHGAKIIMTTAVDDIREVFRCFRELCDAYLVKPIDLTQLLSTLRAFKLVP